MSYYACDTCHRRPHGALGAALLTQLGGQVRHFRRLRLCSSCLESLVAAHDGDWLTDSDGFPGSREMVCTARGCTYRDAHSVEPFFAYVYPRGSEPAVYTGSYCPEHAANAILDYGLELQGYQG